MKLGIRILIITIIISISCFLAWAEDDCGGGKYEYCGECREYGPNPGIWLYNTFDKIAGYTGIVVNIDTPCMHQECLELNTNPLPAYLEPEIKIYCGEADEKPDAKPGDPCGTTIKVYDCGAQSHAFIIFEYPEVERYDACEVAINPWQEGSLSAERRYDYAEAIIHRKTEYDHLYAVFPNDVFNIRKGWHDSSTKSPFCLWTPDFIEVSLVDTSCEGLEKAKNAKVEIYAWVHQLVELDGFKKYRDNVQLTGNDYPNDYGWAADDDAHETVGPWCGNCEESDPQPYDCVRMEILDKYCEYPLQCSPQQEMVYRTEDPILTISVEFKPGDLLNDLCGSPETPKDPIGLSGGSDGCSGFCDGLHGGNLEMPVPNDPIDYSGVNASVYYYSVGETNLKGFWFKPDHENEDWYMAEDVEYDPASDTYTKINIRVDDSIENLKYYYSKAGTWTTDDQAYDENRGSIPLRYVMSGDKTKWKSEYDETNGRITHISTNDSGGDTRYGVYDLDGNGNIARLWIGSDISEYSDYGTLPSGGRWIDLQVDDDTGVITKRTSGCGGCGNGSTKSYSYIEGRSRNLLSSIGDSSENVLVSYKYDSKDRVISHWLGAHDTGLKVAGWEYSDYNDTDPSTNGNNKLIRKDYIDNTHYRAKEILAGNDGTIKEERLYHALQSGNTLTGDYSSTVYEYKYCGSSGESTQKTTILPNGNKLHVYYDEASDGYNITKRTRENRSGSKTINVAQTKYSGSAPPYKVTESIDARGGTTSYSYNGGLLSYSVGPEPKQGVYPLYTYYDYDSGGKLTLECLTDWSYYLSTSYAYDDYGNLITQITGYGGANAATTVYFYNEYNEQTKVKDPRGSYRSTFYSNSGTVTAEWVYANPGCTTLISATEYEFDGNGRLTLTKVANEQAPWATTDTPDWASTQYIYDGYGRKTAQVVDPGVGGRNLTTSYEYNNQSELTKTTGPNGASTITVRDGRGLTEKKIYKFGTRSSTMSFYYDKNGNLIKKVDPEGVTEIYQYDDFDRRLRSRKGK